MIQTRITCADGGSVTTKAGTFDNCLNLSPDIGGMSSGWSYRGGKKVYFFAEGIGIIRTENEYGSGTRTAVYELAAYEGTGKGYMPLDDGMMRRYDAIGLTDGFVGSAVYTCVADEEGDIVLFADKTGIRELPPPITQYEALQGEQDEEKLWNAGKWQESHRLHAVNNFHLLLHYLVRAGRHCYNAGRTTAICGFDLKLLALFGGKNGIPAAWSGVYAWHSLVKAAAMFGKGEKEEGYKCLDSALAYTKKWSSFKRGTLLELGDEDVFGGIGYVKGESVLLLPDGRKELIEDNNCRFDPPPGMMYSCISAEGGWEWFNSVRSKERFRKYVERARLLAEEG